MKKFRKNQKNQKSYTNSLKIKSKLKNLMNKMTKKKRLYKIQTILLNQFTIKVQKKWKYRTNQNKKKVKKNQM